MKNIFRNKNIFSQKTKGNFFRTACSLCTSYFYPKSVSGMKVGQKFEVQNFDFVKKTFQLHIWFSLGTVLTTS